jgi:hypothetical protein
MTEIDAAVMQQIAGASWAEDAYRSRRENQQLLPDEPHEHSCCCSALRSIPLADKMLF